MKISFKAVLPLLCIFGFGQGATIVVAEELYDTDTETLLVDTDGDGYPDVTEKLGGTDPVNASDFPGADLGASADAKSALVKSTTKSTLAAAGFPTASCRPGFRQAGPRLCISQNVQNATRFDRATQRCRDIRSRVATYEDLFYLFIRTNLDATYNPLGKWIGNMTGDDQVMYGNRSITFNNDPDMWNFEGLANKSNNRNYWCAHDDE